jgi:transcriptional regulator with XRE-family HTH domain
VIELNTIFGRNCRRLRESCELTQQQLADENELHRARVAEVERGRKDFKLSTVEQFAAIFGKSPSEMITPY